MTSVGFQPVNNIANHYNMSQRRDVPAAPNYLRDYGNAQSYNPNQFQTPPSSNSSPTEQTKPDPQAANRFYRQLNRQRQPIYVPAALRPTEFGSRPTNIPTRPRAPDTPPASKDNSFDSLKSGGSPIESAVSLSHHQTQEQTELMRGFNEAFSEGLEANLEEVTGLPTTAHWKPDATVTGCAACNATFTWFFRRHHCRHCGNIFCDDHSKMTVPLDQSARYHPDGHRSRSCDRCYMQWKEVKKVRHSRTGSLANSLNALAEQSSQPSGLDIPKAKRPGLEEHHAHSMARSEGAMIWSTF